jgi:glycosyl transferase family 25
MKAFVISLEYRKDRYEYIIQNYIHNTIYDLEIIKAYDGKNINNNSKEYNILKDNFLNNIENNKSKNNYYKYLYINNFTLGEIGCFVSHISIWKKIINENLDQALIFEDDCIFNINFNNRLSYILKNEMPIDCNILWLGGKMCDNHTNNKNTIISNNICIKNEEHPYGTFSYIITNKCAKLLLNYIENEFKGNLGIDYFMNEFLTKNNIIQHVIFPCIVYSTTNNDNSIFKSDIR